MRTLTRRIVATGAAAGLLAIPVTSASASSHTDDSTVTFQVTNTGTLSVAMADKDMGTFDSSSVTEASGVLAEVTVTDNTNPSALDEDSGGWTVTAQSTGFANADSSSTIPASSVSYWSGPVTDLVDADGTSLLDADGDLLSTSLVVATGQQTTAGDAVVIDTAKAAVIASEATGNHELTFTPSLIVDLTGVPADTYTGKITHSVS